MMISLHFGFFDLVSTKSTALELTLANGYGFSFLVTSTTTALNFDFEFSSGFDFSLVLSSKYANLIEETQTPF